MFKKVLYISLLTTGIITNSMENKARLGLTIDISNNKRESSLKTPLAPRGSNNRVTWAEKRPSPNELEHAHTQKRCFEPPFSMPGNALKHPDVYGMYAAAVSKYAELKPSDAYLAYRDIEEYLRIAEYLTQSR